MVAHLTCDDTLVMQWLAMKREVRNTYKAIHVINGSNWTRNANWMYVEWCTGENELLYH